MTRTHPPVAPTRGSRVPKLISVTALAAGLSVRSQVVRATTVATSAEATGGTAVSCAAGSHPPATRPP